MIEGMQHVARATARMIWCSLELGVTLLFFFFQEQKLSGIRSVNIHGTDSYSSDYCVFLSIIRFYCTFVLSIKMFYVHVSDNQKKTNLCLTLSKQSKI